MRQKSVPVNEPATQVLKNVRRATRRHDLARRVDGICNRDRACGIVDRGIVIDWHDTGLYLTVSLCREV